MTTSGVLGPEIPELDWQTWYPQWVDLARSGWALLPLHGITASGLCGCRFTRSYLSNPKNRDTGKWDRPCPSVGKHPCLSGFGLTSDGRPGHCMDGDQLAEFLVPKHLAAEYSVPVQMGCLPYMCSLVVADIDNMAAWESRDKIKYPAPPTLTVTSGRGDDAHHKIYAWDWRAESEDGRVPHLKTALPEAAGEVKHIGMTVLPGSIHKTGRTYQWGEVREIAEAPAWLVEQSSRWSGSDADVAGWSGLPLDLYVGEGSGWVHWALENDLESLRRLAGRLPNTDRSKALYAIALSLGGWTIYKGGLEKSELVRRLVEAAEMNGSLHDYGLSEIHRHISRGITQGQQLARSAAQDNEEQQF